MGWSLLLISKYASEGLSIFQLEIMKKEVGMTQRPSLFQYFEVKIHVHTHTFYISYVSLSSFPPFPLPPSFLPPLPPSLSLYPTPPPFSFLFLSPSLFFCIKLPSKGQKIGTVKKVNAKNKFSTIPLILNRKYLGRSDK